MRTQAFWTVVRISLLLFALLAISVNVPRSPVRWVDRTLAVWLHSHQTDAGLALSEAIVVLGNDSVIVPLTAAVAVVVGIVHRSLLRPLAIVGAVAFSGVASLTVKWLLPSRHPDLNIGEQPALAHMYPSSHMAVFATLLGATAVATVVKRTILQIVLAGCGILSSLMAFGLAVGQFHWLSDIAGGALLAVATIAVTQVLLRRAGPR